MSEVIRSSNQVQLVDELTAVTLRGVIDRTIDVIVLEGTSTAAEGDAALRMANDLTATTASDRGGKFQKTTALSIGQAGESDEMKTRYFRQGQEAVRVIRRAFGGGTPLDRVVHEVLAIWPRGVALPFDEGAAAQPQHIRVWPPFTETPVHIDTSRTHRVLGKHGTKPG